MRTLARRLWNEPVLFTAALGAVGTVPDLPGPRWPWGVAAVLAGVFARHQVDGPATKADRR